MHHFNWSGVIGALPTLWTGAIITLQITVLAIVVGIVWGTVIAMMRLSGIKPLVWFANIYVTLFRSIPLVMVLLWFFLIVPQLLQNVLGLSADIDIRARLRDGRVLAFRGRVLFGDHPRRHPVGRARAGRTRRSRSA